MGLFALVLALEILPMVTLIRWRAAKSRGGDAVADSDLGRLIALNAAETVIIVVIPFVAVLMARGGWLF